MSAVFQSSKLGVILTTGQDFYSLLQGNKPNIPKEKSRLFAAVSSQLKKGILNMTFGHYASVFRATKPNILTTCPGFRQPSLHKQHTLLLTRCGDVLHHRFAVFPWTRNPQLNIIFNQNFL